MWHMSKFQAGEIIDLAVEIEKKGGQFYNRLAAKAPNDNIKNLLLYLAAEEEQHQIRFRELGQNLTEVNFSETYPGEYLEYIGLSVDNHMFSNEDKLKHLVEHAQSGLDIIKLATDFERDTILFFNGFRNLLVEEKQGVIDDLIMEEQIHLVKLARLRKEVLAQDGK